MEFSKNAFDNANLIKVGAALCDPFWGTRMWLGASINVSSMKWTWLDGSPLGYRMWAKGYPTKTTGSESCLYIDYTDGKWYNDDCYADACFLCQYPPQTAEKKRCLAGLLQGTDGCYSFTSMSRESYAAAKLHCGALGGALPIVKSAEDNMALVNLARSTCTQDQALWLGADKRQSTSWTWNDGSPLTYTNWADGYPSNDASAECIFLNLSDGKWYNFRCDGLVVGLCKVS
ncbi:mannose receptor C type 1-like protein [Aphelenchoides avenae]|nr:mannose receptor C type 1-like protein [Aphelenchus avenae]